MYTIPEIEKMRDDTLKNLAALQDGEVESRRREFLEMATTSQTRMRHDDICYFHNKIKAAETADDVRKVLSVYFQRLINDEKFARREENPLVEVLDYGAGVWRDGKRPDRRIEITELPNGKIHINNDNDEFNNETTVTQEDFMRHCRDDALRYTTYYDLFVKAALENPETAPLIQKAELQTLRRARSITRRARQEALRNYLRRSP
ncbi:MAG: hypothetical protein EA357_03475 [Micavibrio sp.]|nr:MAG: hypothetical protein EA357_03475 [Micavibrio sp.]